MQMPTFKEAQALRQVAVEAAAKKRELIARNREAARALLSSIQSSQIQSVTRIIQKENVDS